MTIITSFSVGRHPVMLGDLLLSGPEPDTQIMRVPSVGWATNVFPQGSGYTITGLSQKLTVIHPDLAMAWAGTYIKARAVATELKQLASGSEIDLDAISGFLKEVRDDSALQDLSLILLVSDRQAALVHTLSVRARESITDHYGRVCVAGTGHADIISQLKRLECAEVHRESNLNSLELATFYAGSLAATMLTWDVTNMRSLLQYYGGGSEIVTLISGGFAKLDKLAYVMWFAHAVKPGKIFMFDPIKIMYYSYRQDCLFLHALQFDPYADKAHRTIDNTHYLIHPVYGMNTHIDTLTEFERERCYEPNHFVHMIQVVDSSGQRIIGHFHLFRSNFDNPDVKISFEPRDKITLTTQKGVVESIFTKVVKIVRDNKRQMSN